MSKRILVVDDYAVIAEAITTMTTMEGYDVRTVRSGEEALVAAETFQPDLMILDLMLGDGIGGEEVLTSVCRRRPGTRVLIVSALVTASRSPIVPEPGHVELLAKPFKVRDLSMRIARMLTSPQSSAA